MKKNQIQKLEEIQNILMPNPKENHSKGIDVTFSMENNFELLLLISSLIKMSIMTMEGQGCSSIGKGIKYHPDINVIYILELVEKLLPFDQIENYDKIKTIILTE